MLFLACTSNSPELVNVPPRTPCADVLNGGPRPSNDGCNARGADAALFQLPNVADFGFGQFLVSRQPVFVGAVLNVLALRSEKQMFRINAGWCVTAMAHEGAIRNRTVVQFVRQAMRQQLPSWLRAAARCVNHWIARPSDSGAP